MGCKPLDHGAAISGVSVSSEKSSCSIGRDGYALFWNAASRSQEGSPGAPLPAACAFLVNGKLGLLARDIHLLDPLTRTLDGRLPVSIRHLPNSPSGGRSGQLICPLRISYLLVFRMEKSLPTIPRTKTPAKTQPHRTVYERGARYTGGSHPVAGCCRQQRFRKSCSSLNPLSLSSPPSPGRERKSPHFRFLHAGIFSPAVQMMPPAFLDLRAMTSPACSRCPSPACPSSTSPWLKVLRRTGSAAAGEKCTATSQASPSAPLPVRYPDFRARVQSARANTIFILMSRPVSPQPAKLATISLLSFFRNQDYDRPSGY